MKTNAKTQRTKGAKIRGQGRLCMDKYTNACKGFVEHYRGRPWTSVDGLPEKDLNKVEARLGITLPSALRAFYLSDGAVADLRVIHNIIFHPTDLVLEDGYLISWMRTRVLSHGESSGRI